MYGIQNQIVQLHASHAFISVDVFVDGKRIGKNGTFTRVTLDVSCTQVLHDFLKSDASEYILHLESTNVIMMCVKICDTSYARQARL